jgi:hypothetical protein
VPVTALAAFAVVRRPFDLARISMSTPGPAHGHRQAPPPSPLPPGRHGDQGRATGWIDYLLHGKRRPNQITVVSHSDLFYWWPVWLIGFFMTILTYMHGVHAGFVAGDPQVIEIDAKVDYKILDSLREEKSKEGSAEGLKAIISSTNKSNPFPMTFHGGEQKHIWPWMHSGKNIGVLFTVVLLLVIVITNVHLRGLWSLIVIIVLVLGTIIMALSGLLEDIIAQSRFLAIYLNMGAYFFISFVLFVVWTINFAFFDRQRYVIVEAGQVKLRLAIGEGEITYDTMGMVFQKQRSELFRHWILGFGSGDLVIRPAGGKDPIDLPNVLFVGGKVRAITDLIKEKQVVAG